MLKSLSLKLEKRKLDLQKDPDSFRQVSKSLDFRPLHGHTATSTPLSLTSTSKGPEKLGTSGPAPSNLLDKLAGMANNGRLNRHDMLEVGTNQPSRSMSFADAAARSVVRYIIQFENTNNSPASFPNVTKTFQ
jgi:hypothetical protein